jgi:peroxiredoxin Q/BCP
MASKKRSKKSAKKSKPAKKIAKKGKPAKKAAKKSKPAKKVAKKSAPKPAAKVSKPNKKTVVKKTKAKKKTTAKKKVAAKVETPSTDPIGEGDMAPEFKMADQGGGQVSSADLAGKPYVLYFYPKDDTPGCTAEACGFQDDSQTFADAGVRVIGVSPDSPQSHARFRSKYGLKFTLLSDTDKQLAKRYGTWVLKKNYGKEYMGVLRSTFLVDATGRVKRAWRGVKVPGHVEAVRAAVQQL